MRSNKPCITLSSFFLLLLLRMGGSQQAAIETPEAWSSSTPTISFHPSVAIVVGVFSLIFSLTFLLLIYAKFCHNTTTHLFSTSTNSGNLSGIFLPLHRTFSGIDKSLIDSLPFFPFSSLRGARQGLECAVCLSKFHDTDLLRLLPKCNHAFHVNCIDKWLELHSSCPLCRCRVEAGDALRFKYSTSSRFLFSSDRHENLELFVEREPPERLGNGRSASFRLVEAGDSRKCVEDEMQGLHKFKHRVVMSDAVFKGRWSDLNSKELLSLNSDLLNLASSKRFADSNAVESSSGCEVKVVSDETLLRIKEELERKRILEAKASQIGRIQCDANSETGFCCGSSVSSSTNAAARISSGKRSMSEITNLSRFRMLKETASSSSLNGSKDDKVSKLWLPIARRTVQWLAGRERRSQTQDSIAESIDV